MSPEYKPTGNVWINRRENKENEAVSTAARLIAYYLFLQNGLGLKDSEN